MGLASFVGRAGHPRLLPKRPEAATVGLAYEAPVHDDGNVLLLCH